MSMTDPIADRLTRIRNVARLDRKRCRVPYSRMKKDILDVLQREGFIAGYEVRDARVGKEIEVELRYGPEGERILNHLERVSKPGRREYRPADGLDRVRSGMGIYVVSTSKGVLSDNEARAQGIGGEVLCRIF